MRILVVSPPLADPLPLTPYGLAVAEHHRWLGHSVHVHDPIPTSLDGCLAPDAVTEGIEEGRRRFQSLERQHTLSADDAAIHRSLADTVPLAEEVTRRLPRARSHLFTRDAWAPGGSGGWPSALADATILRVALALSRVRPTDVAVDPRDLVSGVTPDRVVIAVSTPLQLRRGRELAERIRRGGGEAVIVRAPWVGSGGTAGPAEDVLDPERGREPQTRVPVWAPWDPGALPPRSHVWSLAAERPVAASGPPGADVVGLELRLDPDSPDQDLLRWAGETGLPLRLRVPDGWLDTARDDTPVPLGELACRAGVEIAAHPMGGAPGPRLGSWRPSLFRDRTWPAVSWLGFADAVRIVQAAGRQAYRALAEPPPQPLPVDPPPPDAVFVANPDAVVVRLTHDPTRALHRGGVGRTAGEQAAAGLAPGRGHPFAYDLARRRRIPLSHPAHHVAAHVDGVRTVAEIARGLDGGSEDEKLLARTVTVFSELESAGVVTRT